MRGLLAAEQAQDIAHRREGQAAVGGDEEARRLELRKGCPARAESGLSAPAEPPKRDCPIRSGDKDVAVQAWSLTLLAAGKRSSNWPVSVSYTPTAAAVRTAIR